MLFKSAVFCKKAGLCLGLLKARALSDSRDKVRAFVKTSKTYRIRKLRLMRAFSDQRNKCQRGLFGLNMTTGSALYSLWTLCVIEIELALAL